MKKGWNIIVAVVVALLVVVMSLIYFGVIPSPDASVGVEGSPYDEEILPPSGRQDDNVLTQASCSDAGGTWNSCGSACRTDPDAICIELCVEYCECQSDAQCPSGSTCGDFVEGVGVCL